MPTETRDLDGDQPWNLGVFCPAASVTVLHIDILGELSSAGPSL